MNAIIDWLRGAEDPEAISTHQHPALGVYQQRVADIRAIKRVEAKRAARQRDMQHHIDALASARDAERAALRNLARSEADLNSTTESRRTLYEALVAARKATSELMPAAE